MTSWIGCAMSLAGYWAVIVTLFYSANTSVIVPPNYICAIAHVESDEIWVPWVNLWLVVTGVMALAAPGSFPSVEGISILAYP